MYQLDKEKFITKSYTNIPYIENKKVLLRTCLNVITDSEGNMTDATRYHESFPAIKALAEQAKMLLITAHLGRPKHNEAQYSFAKIAQKLATDL
jgi:3-phosphoglycerate kinase